MLWSISVSSWGTEIHGNLVLSSPVGAAELNISSGTLLRPGRSFPGRCAPIVTFQIQHEAYSEQFGHSAITIRMTVCSVPRHSHDSETDSGWPRAIPALVPGPPSLAEPQGPEARAASGESAAQGRGIEDSEPRNREPEPENLTSSSLKP